MIPNRELTMDDYLAMLRRRLAIILLPVLLVPVAAYFLSYAFTPRYTSQSLILVETQKVPEGYVQPVVTAGIDQRIATMQQQVLSENLLQPMIDRLGLAKGKNVDDVIDSIRKNFVIEGVAPDLSGSRNHRTGQSDVPGFFLNFTADSAGMAQQVCTELTSMLLAENLKTREQVAQGTTDFLTRQVGQAKHDLDDQDAKLASFKKKYLGQLPGDEDNNIKLLMGMDAQLDANTQTLNRAQQDRAYAQSILSQQLAAWKASQAAMNPDSLQKQLAELQNQLIALRARYTDDYPDVMKVRGQIAEVKGKLADINAASAQAASSAGKGSANEPAEIQQLRLQIHQYDGTIAQATREQERLQDSIHTFQGRLALSPGVEEQYKELTRDYETAQKVYNDLMVKKSASEIQTDMERRQEGEQMSLLNPANFPDSPSFPNRLLFGLGGAGAGLALGLGLALWLEMRDKALRTEQDVLAALSLPMLVAVPWIDPADEKSRRNGKKKPPTQASAGRRGKLSILEV
ncbi:MAG: Wzz/FepE/Etk N-terminal domain-containing protein [Terriglobales bacterium]